MEIVFLGTGSAYPSPTRSASCIIVRHGGNQWMFDCGEGSQIQLMRSCVKPGKTSKIFITHLHGDHIFGLPGLLCTISQNFCPQTKELVELYGPRGLRQFIRTSLILSHSQLGFNYSVHELVLEGCQLPDGFPNEFHNDCVMELHPNEIAGSDIQAVQIGGCYQWLIHEDSQVKVTAGMLRHRITCFGYVIEEQQVRGKLDVMKLKAKGILPGPLFARVKAGETVVAPSGELIQPCDVVGPDQPGIKVAILGDTCDSSLMSLLCQDVDVLVHESTLANEMLDNAVEKGHSTPGMAGNFARSVCARHLVLTHFSQRYKSNPSSEDDDSISLLVEQAKQAFGSGAVFAADDFTSVIVKRNRSDDASLPTVVVNNNSTATTTGAGKH